MNKKLLLLGAFALATGFFALTAFDGKTLEQQKAEIAQTITMKLDELRAAKDQECTDKINIEAQRKFDEIVAARAAEAAAKPGKKPVKKPGSKGTKVEPLPQAPPPAPTDPKKDKMEGGVKTQEKQDKMQGQPTSTEKKKAKMQGGGGGN